MSRLEARRLGNSRVAELNSTDLNDQSGFEVWIPRLGVSRSNLRREKELFGRNVDESCFK